MDQIGSEFEDQLRQLLNNDHRGSDYGAIVWFKNILINAVLLQGDADRAEGRGVSDEEYRALNRRLAKLLTAIKRKKNWPDNYDSFLYTVNCFKEQQKKRTRTTTAPPPSKRARRA